MPTSHTYTPRSHSYSPTRYVGILYKNKSLPFILRLMNVFVLSSVFSLVVAQHTLLEVLHIHRIVTVQHHLATVRHLQAIVHIFQLIAPVLLLIALLTPLMLHPPMRTVQFPQLQSYFS